MQISLARTVNITALQLIIEAQYLNAAVLDDQQQLTTNAVPDLPAFMSHFFGDDDQIRLSIDLDTGHVQGWISPTAAQLQAFAFPELEVINPEPMAVAVLDDYGMSWGVYSEGEPITAPSRLAAEKLAQSMREQNPTHKHLIYAAPWREVAPVNLPVPTAPVAKAALSSQIDIEEAIAADQPELGVIETLTRIEDAIAAAGTTEDTAPAQSVILSKAQQFERDLQRINGNEDVSADLFKCYEARGLAIGTKPLSLNDQGEVKGFCVWLTAEGENFLNQLKSCTSVEVDELVAAHCLPDELDYQHMADSLYDLLNNRRAYTTSHHAKQVVDTSAIAAPAVVLREDATTEDLSKDVIFTVRETGKSHVAEYLGHQKRSLSNSHSPTYSAINLLAQSLGMGDVVMITAMNSQVAGALGVRKYKIDNSLTKDKLAVYVRHDGRRYTARTLG
ncbi:MAG: hypothetical protein VXW65_12300, partial [Pseudomonadota bacterium]|nr:hypothetical protein [Pseudomonadota bacterium]